MINQDTIKKFYHECGNHVIKFTEEEVEQIRESVKDPVGAMIDRCIVPEDTKSNFGFNFICNTILIGKQKVEDGISFLEVAGEISCKEAGEILTGFSMIVNMMGKHPIAHLPIMSMNILMDAIIPVFENFCKENSIEE